tara:strand:- start:111376 stop:111840 length:465 start_codon:yes stop_codon:yes gene_type:complete
MRSIPLPALAFGIAGLIPFWLCAGGVWMPELRPGAYHAYDAAFALIAYGAVILTFLGAMHWGVILRGKQAETGEEATWARLGFSIAPSIVGWVATLMNPVYGLLMLIIGHGIVALADLQTVRRGEFPLWYGTLRKYLSILAILAMTTGLMGLPA